MLGLNLSKGHYDADIDMYLTKWDDRFTLFQYIVTFLSIVTTIILIVLQACKVINIGWWWPFSPMVFAVALISLALAPMVFFDKI